ADYEREHGRRSKRDGPLDETCENSFMRQHSDGVTANPKIGRMAEAHHAAIAENQIEANRRERQNYNAGEEREHERTAGELDIDGQQRQCEQQCDNGDRARGQPATHYFPLAENSPSGLTTSTTAIRR